MGNKIIRAKDTDNAIKAEPEYNHSHGHEKRTRWVVYPTAVTGCRN